jgi:hypothetical protein
MRIGRKAKMNNQIDNNQHFISESFTKRRFGTNGSIERYDLERGWATKHSPKFVFSGPGYTQMLMDGELVDNSLEQSFGKIENHLQFIFPALDEAANRNKLVVSREIYDNLCLYCAYLYHLSPFSKANSPAEYAIALNLDLEHRNVNHLLDLKVARRDITTIQKRHFKGDKLVISGDNFLQWTFRTQFVRNAIWKAALFRDNTKWTVYNSPLELPISDIALIDYPDRENKATLYILPISPHSVLIGRLEHGTPPPFYTTDTIIYGDTLTNEAAESVQDIICLSALKTIAAKNRIDIKAIRERAEKRNIAFTKIKVDLDSVLSAGTKSFNPNTFRIVPVAKDEYVRFVHSFIQPPNRQN